MFFINVLVVFLLNLVILVNYSKWKIFYIAIAERTKQNKNDFHKTSTKKIQGQQRKILSDK